MGPENLAEACKEERDALLALYADVDGGSSVGEHLRVADLSQAQHEHVIAALHDALTDAFYTMLLALDGAASLGGRQQAYTLSDASGSAIASGDGRLEAAAWAALQKDSA